MQQGMHLFVLIIYLTSLFFLGWFVIKKWFSGLPTLMSFVGSMLIGIDIGVPITYLLSILVKQTGEPILWGTILLIAILAVAALFVRVKKFPSNYSLTISDILIIFFAIIFSSWLMTKTFHGGTDGTLFVGSNNVFDFGNALGIVRSFSWGENIPFTSPFRAGLPLFYHFLFYFFVSIWEYFGVPVLWAINITSILSFSALLIIIYNIPQLLFKQKRITGWFAVILTVTNSTLAFWNILLSRGFSKETFMYIWRLPTYPYAGPFDGSAISLFMTLNNYVNQRHLAFATASGLFIIILMQKKISEKQVKILTSFIMGLLCGTLFFWNMAVCLLTGVVIAFLLALEKKWKDITAFVIPYGLCITFIMIPYIVVLGDLRALIAGLFSISSSIYAPATWTIADYLWQNLGILPIVACIGYIVLPQKTRKVSIPFIALFIGLCLYAGLGKHGFDQKFLSFLVIWIDILAAVGLVWIWNSYHYTGKIVSVILFGILTISGIVDLMPIKNEFAFPIVSKEILPVISWIHSNTSKDSVFVSYSDMIDPVVFAGRRNYFGFFGNVGLTDRSRIVQSIYNGNKNSALRSGVSYALIPKFAKNDFPYEINIKALSSAGTLVYDDSKFSIYAFDK